MTDERREGRSDGREDTGEVARLGILAGALRRRDERLQRATAAMQRLGEGAVYGTDVLLSIEAAERLANAVANARQPNLGFATTRHLLDEIRTRIEMDYFDGGGGLDYSTIEGRPVKGPGGLE